MWQDVIVIVLVVGALVYAIWRVKGVLRGKVGCGCGCANCSRSEKSSHEKEERK